MIHGGSLTSGTFRYTEAARAQELVMSVTGQPDEATFVAIFSAKRPEQTADVLADAARTALAPLRNDPRIERVVLPEEAPSVIASGIVNREQRTLVAYVTLKGTVAEALVLFLVTYLLIIVMGDIPTYFKNKDNPYFASVGASGGVSGILFIFILLHPWSMLGLFAIIPVPAIIFGVLYLWYSTWASKNQNGNIDHEAHFYGAVAGMLIAIITRPEILSEFAHHLINNFPFR